MFITPDLPMALKAVTLKQDKEGERFACCKFVLEPFTEALAREIGEEVATHLFNDAGDPRFEVADVKFRLMLRRQQLTARMHPELAELATLSNVGLEDVRVTRPDPEKKRLRLEFVAVVPLETRIAIEFVVQSFGNALYITLAPHQADLLDNAAADALDDLAAHVDGKELTGMSLSTIEDGKETKVLEVTPEDGARARRRRAARTTH